MEPPILGRSDVVIIPVRGEENRTQARMPVLLEECGDAVVERVFHPQAGILLQYWAIRGKMNAIPG